jgi:hypothetical protein
MATGRLLFALTSLTCLLGVQAMAADGLITLRSNYGPKEPKEIVASISALADSRASAATSIGSERSVHR